MSDTKTFYEFDMLVSPWGDAVPDSEAYLPVEAEWHCGHGEHGHEPCTPMEPHRHDWSCGWLVKP